MVIILIKEFDLNSKKTQNIQYLMQPRYINVNFDRYKKFTHYWKVPLSIVCWWVVYATSYRVSPRFEITNRSLTTIEDRWWPRWHRRPTRHDVGRPHQVCGRTLNVVLVGPWAWYRITIAMQHAITDEFTHFREDS